MTIAGGWCSVHARSFPCPVCTSAPTVTFPTPDDRMPPLWCDLCGGELTEPGALIFSPPNDRNQVGKFHICPECWTDLERTLIG